MKCPKCQAKLLPVDGVMFCLQCGTAVEFGPEDDRAGPELEDTADPLLQKAIVDAAHHPVNFRTPVPVNVVRAAKPALRSMRGLLAEPIPGAVGTAVLTPQQSVAVHEADDFEAELSFGEPARRLGISTAWLAGLVSFVCFILLNASIFAMLDGRVYPGVRVGDENIGGTKFQDLPPKLAALTQGRVLAVTVGDSTYRVGSAELGAEDLGAVEREAKSVGHSTPLPVAGLLEALLSKPLAPHFEFNKEGLEHAAAQISAAASRPASNAVPLVMAGQAFLITDKDGAELDSQVVEQGFKQALSTRLGFSLKVVPLKSHLQSGAYTQDIAAAQARLALRLQVTVKATRYLPSAGDIGNWLVFNGPGKGVSADPLVVGTYVATWPGQFDRLGVTQALVNAVNAGQPLSYSASTARVTNVPGGLPALSLPLTAYNYCAIAPDQQAQKELEKDAASALADDKGWGLGGRLRFTLGEQSCMFTLQLMPASDLAKVKPACSKQTTCLDGATIFISKQAWMAPPKTWSGGLDKYRQELVNHEVGHWLGFEHPSCTARSVAPILEAPTLVLDGCSPNWYEIPAEEQGSKVLPGF